MVTESNGVIHVTVPHIRTGGAAIGHGTTGEIAIVGDLVQHTGHLLGLFLGKRGERAADAAIVNPSCLEPRFGHRLILVDRVRGPAQILEILKPGENGGKEF